MLPDEEFVGVPALDGAAAMEGASVADGLVPSVPIEAGDEGEASCPTETHAETTAAATRNETTPRTTAR